MSPNLASLAALASLWLSLAVLVVLASRLLWPAIVDSARPRDPEARARVAFFMAIAPILLPSAIVLLCALPGLAGALTGTGDHCAGHGEHPHFCPVHATLTMTPLLGLGLAAFSGLVVCLCTLTAAQLRSLAREQRWLERRHAGDLEPGVHLVAGEAPIALTSGFTSPEIWVAETLLAALDTTDRAIVLAHERAHAARRDPARFLAAALASRFHFPAIRESVLRTLRLAAEQACDARAAAAVGDGLRVAATLLRVERLMQRAPRAIELGAALVDAGLPARIEALISTGVATSRRERSPRWPWLLALAALLLAGPVHHLAEHALEALLRSMVGLALLS